MITFKDYTREESEAKYYTMSSHGNYVYSHKEDQKEQIAFEKVYNEPTIKGNLKELKQKYKIVSWVVAGSELRGNKEKNYLSNNPYLKK